MTRLGNKSEVKIDIRPNGLLCVPVRINGEGPYPFLFDTGAVSTGTSPEVAQALQLKRLDVPNKECFYSIVDFAVGGTQLSNFSLYVWDCSQFSKVAGSRVEGLMGYNFIKEFRVTINYPEKTFALKKSKDWESLGDRIKTDKRI